MGFLPNENKIIVGDIVVIVNLELHVSPKAW
jgi:hypothetical protein